MIMNKGSRK